MTAVIDTPFLPLFFEELQKSRINYLVLRGYENLPGSFEHDLDFFVNEDDLANFYQVIHHLSSLYKYEIKRDEVRQGLIKVQLLFREYILKIDVFFEFRYAGLEYIEKNSLLQQKIYHNDIPVANAKYEFFTSFLKEILHNARIRKDKIEKIKKLREKFSDTDLDFDGFFSDTVSRQLIQMLDNAVYLDYKLANSCRRSLLISNLRRTGFFSVVLNIIIYFTVKYLFQSIYDKKFIRIKA